MGRLLEKDANSVRTESSVPWEASNKVDMWDLLRNGAEQATSRQTTRPKATIASRKNKWEARKEVDTGVCTFT